MCNKISGTIVVAAICFFTWEISGMDRKEVVVYQDTVDAGVSRAIVRVYGNCVKKMYCAVRRDVCLFCESLQKDSYQLIENSADKILNLYKDPQGFNYARNWDVEQDKSLEPRNGFLRSGDIKRIKQAESSSAAEYFFCSVILFSSLLVFGCCVSS